MNIEERRALYLEKEFNFEVDYGKSPIRLIGEGDYDYVNGKFVNWFKIPGELAGIKVTRSARLWVPETDMPGYRMASFFELLGFGSKHPDVARSFILYCGEAWKNEDRTWEEVYIGSYLDNGCQLNSGEVWTSGSPVIYLGVKK